MAFTFSTLCQNFWAKISKTFHPIRKAAKPAGGIERRKAGQFSLSNSFSVYTG